MGRNSMSALDSFVKIRYAFSARKYNVFLWADFSRFGESAPGIPALLVGESVEQAFAGSRLPYLFRS